MKYSLEVWDNTWPTYYQKKEIKVNSDEKAISKAIDLYGKYIYDNSGDYTLKIRKYNPETKRYKNIAYLGFAGMRRGIAVKWLK